MPRIRKKTSKRGTTHQRSKVKHKVAESRKKAKKEAKKNPQWKSKHKKDPGIPNNFPYKDQILAEIAAQKRQEEEDKQKRKEQRKAEKAAAKIAEADEDEQQDMSGLVGVSSIGSSTLQSSKGSSAKGLGRSSEANEDDAPILINSEYKDMRSVLNKVDVVLHVLDVREPLASSSVHLREYVENKGKGKVAFVLNKIDTCPREAVRSWLTRLRRDAPTFLFRSASAFLPQSMEQQNSPIAGQNTKLSREDAVGTSALLDFLSSQAGAKDQLHVAIVGVANAGKSSLVNSLLQKPASLTYKLTSVPSGPSTTERPLEVSLTHNGKTITLIDTPALSWEHVSDLDGAALAKQRANDMLLRSKGRIDKAKEPVAPVLEIVERADAEDLMLFYTLPAFTPGDGTAFLAALARSKGLVKARGEVDRIAAARIVLRDWGTGKLPRYAQPPAAATTEAKDDSGAKGVDGVDTEVDEQLLAAAPPRKEMRKGRGIVRLKPRDMETRKIALDLKWDEEKDAEEESGEEEEAEADDQDVGSVEEDAEEDGVDDNDQDKEEDDEDDEDEDVNVAAFDEETDEEVEEDMVDLPPLPKGKRKRSAAAPPPRPAPKKVAFAPPPKGSKQARAQSSSKKPEKAGKLNGKGKRR